MAQLIEIDFSADKFSACADFFVKHNGGYFDVLGERAWGRIPVK